jgi:hypothetical protein
LAVPGGALVLQVIHESPTRAAGLLLIKTVVLPIKIMPSLLGGGGPNGPGPTGTCGGMCCKPLPNTAAGLPPINTLVLHCSKMVAL